MRFACVRVVLSQTLVAMRPFESYLAPSPNTVPFPTFWHESLFGMHGRFTPNHARKLRQPHHHLHGECYFHKVDNDQQRLCFNIYHTIRNCMNAWDVQKPYKLIGFSIITLNNHMNSYGFSTCAMIEHHMSSHGF